MLVILVRTSIVFLLLLIGLRLMGKRQIGELQPFEFVITLVVADLACTPMQDISVPLVYGVVPVLIIFVIHFALTSLCTKSIKFRKFMNGKPSIVINKDGIDSGVLKSLNMNVNDLMESIRVQQCFSIEQVRFGIVETNGQLSVLPNEDVTAPKAIPVMLVCEGHIMHNNIAICGLTSAFITDYLTEKQLKARDIILMTKELDKLFVQPYNAPYFTEIKEGI
ncbi:MAG: DUF421 domain-containing protein [Bacillota bacterium]